MTRKEYDRITTRIKAELDRAEQELDLPNQGPVTRERWEGFKDGVIAVSKVVERVYWSKPKKVD